MTERTSCEPDAGDVERACEIMHDAYEAAAVEAGWETQERSRKPWADVPEANKATMRAAVRALFTTALPALGYSKADPAPSRSVRRRLDLMAQADPARVKAGQPQAVAWRCLRAGSNALTADPEVAKVWGDVWGVDRLVTLADALAYAEQQRQAAVGDGQVVVDRDRMRLAVVYHGWQAERGGCPAGCDLPLGSSLADHAIDVALGTDDVVPERWRTRPDETREGS